MVAAAASGGGGGVDSGSRKPFKIIVNVFISFVGAGVLGLPYGFRQSGILEGTLIMLVVSYFSVKAMFLIIECKYTILAKYHSIDRQSLLVAGENGEEDRCESDDDGSDSESRKQVPPVPDDNITYSEVGFYACGLVGQRVVDFAIVVSQIGFCCAYLIFISENLSSYWPSVRKTTWLLMMLPLLFLLTLYRELHKLAFFSLFAQISSLMAFAVVFWFDFENIAHAKKRFSPREWSVEGFPFFFAIAIYCYEGAGMILALETSVAKPIRHKFKMYFLIVIFFVTLLYLSFGICGYLSFGDDTNAIITLNLPRASGLDAAKIVKLCLCFSLFLTYPVMMFPVTQLLEKQAFCATTKGSLTRRALLRCLLVSLTGLVVLCIPNFANLMALVGATCCTLLAFILPGYFHLLLHRKTLSPNDRALDLFLVFFGILGTIIGTLDAVRRLSLATETTADSDRFVNHNIATTTQSAVLAFGKN